VKIVTKVIIIPEENLDRYYERTIERLRAKYHSRPTMLSSSHTIEQPASLDTPYSQLNYAQSQIPIGKLVG